MTDLRASIRQAESLIDAVAKDIMSDEALVARIEEDLEEQIKASKASIRILNVEIDKKRKLQRREQALLQKLLERYHAQPRSR